MRSPGAWPIQLLCENKSCFSPRKAAMPRVLLGITGSVAAIRAPALLRQLLENGHDVKAVATRASRYFFDPADLGRDPGIPANFVHDRLFLDEDEWPGARYERDQPVLHIELRRGPTSW